jgi:hypothetical protein
VWLFWALLMLTLLLHLIAMNLLLGGSVMAAYARLRHAGHVHARQFVDRFVRLSPVLVAATVTLGVAPLLFLQVLYGRLFFTSSVLMAWLWLAIVPAVIFVYASAYAMSYATRRRATPKWLHVASVLVLLGIAFLYSTNMTLMLRADRFGALYAASGRGLHLNTGDPTFFVRWMHMVLGAVGVAGVAAAVFATAIRSTEPAFASWLGRYGGTWSAVATAINIVVGGVWLLALPQRVLASAVSSPVGGVSLVVGVVAGFAVLALLVAMSRGHLSTPVASGAAATMLATVVSMLLARDAVRTAALNEVAFTPVRWVEPQWVPIALFLVFLVVAIGVVGWMVYQLRRAPAAAPTQNVTAA